MAKRTPKIQKEQTVSAEALRQALIQLTRDSLPAGAMNILVEYIQKLSTTEGSTVVSLDEVYPYMERLVADSKDDYLHSLLVVQSLEDLFQQPQ